jgi:hypothetical protein
MPDSELAAVSVDSFLAHGLNHRGGPLTRKKFFEFLRSRSATRIHGGSPFIPEAIQQDSFLV